MSGRGCVAAWSLLVLHFPSFEEQTAPGHRSGEPAPLCTPGIPPLDPTLEQLRVLSLGALGKGQTCWRAKRCWRLVLSDSLRVGTGVEIQALCPGLICSRASSGIREPSTAFASVLCCAKPWVLWLWGLDVAALFFRSRPADWNPTRSKKDQKCLLWTFW